MKIIKSHETFRWWLLPETVVEHSQRDTVGADTNHTSPDWTAAVLRWSHLNTFLNYLCFILTFLWKSFLNSVVICQEQNLLTATSWVLCRTWQRSWEKTVIKEDRKHFLLISYLLFYFILRSYPRRILFSLAEWRDRRFRGPFHDPYLDKEQLDLVQLSSFQTSLVNLTLTYNFLHGTLMHFRL